MFCVKSFCLLAITIGVFAEEHVGYKFEYGVNDPHTKDHKSHYEHRDGDHVVGQYTLQEPDGTHRIVKYKSGPHTGFEAVVEIVGHALHPGHSGHHEGATHEGATHEGATSHVGTVQWGNQGNEEKAR